jgi:hypothetical protein
VTTTIAFTIFGYQLATINIRFDLDPAGQEVPHRVVKKVSRWWTGVLTA